MRFQGIHDSIVPLSSLFIAMTDVDFSRTLRDGAPTLITLFQDTSQKPDGVLTVFRSVAAVDTHDCIVCITREPRSEIIDHN